MPKKQATDAIDVFIAEWVRERPDLDFDYLATVGRMVRIAAHLRERMDAWLTPFGLSWELFDLLASLRRAGGRDGLRPTDLYHACMLSSGATTNRIDRAEKLGLVERRPDPDDGRATRIALTKRGRSLVDKAMNEHTMQAGAIAAALSAEDRKKLKPLLGKLLQALERPRLPAKGRAETTAGVGAAAL